MIDAFNGVTKLYVDANILIYLFEETPSFNDTVVVAFKFVQGMGIRICTSEITLTECLSGAYRYGDQRLVQRYLDIISDANFVTLIPIQLEICIGAARLGAEHRLKTMDAIHFASAAYAGCEAFLTNDYRFKSNENIRVTQLSQFSAGN